MFKSWIKFKFSLGEDHSKSGPECVTKIAGEHKNITLQDQEALQIPDNIWLKNNTVLKKKKRATIKPFSIYRLIQFIQ